MPINTTDMAKLEVKYRKVLKCMMSLPDCVATPLVYLSIGVLPAEAQRDLEILGLLGQLVKSVISYNLAFFDEKFGGWSGLVRKTALEYDLPDPLQYLDKPWRPDRWRAHCKMVISTKWDKKLRQELEPKSSSVYIDIESLSTTTPMRIFQQAGLNSGAVKEATIVCWMFCGVYFTRQFLHTMKKIKTPSCACDPTVSETLPHFLLHCQLYDDIRHQYIPKYIEQNKNIVEICDNEDLLITSVLDPLSCKLPLEVINSWSSVKQAYEISRKFCYQMHLKRDKIYNELDSVS